MRLLKINCFLCILALFLCGTLSSFCQAQSRPADGNTVLIQGRVLVQQHGSKEWIVVHSKEAKAYSVEGALTEQLKQIAIEKGSRAIVTLEGILTGASNVSCEQTRNSETDSDGKKQLKVDVRCIRYLIINVKAINAVIESDEAMPEPQGDATEEKKVLARAQQKNLQEAIMGEIYGKITSCNLRSVVKTITVRNTDNKSPIKSLNMLITADTRIAKKIGKSEPVPMLPDNLKPGQKVTVVYSQRETGMEALFITITKD